MPVPHRGLLDLPNELLLEVFEYPRLTTNDLYHVATLCRKLNLLALPVFLSRHNIPNPEDSITLESIVWNPATGRQPIDALAGLQIATYLVEKQIKEVICNFQFPYSAHNTQQCTDDLHLAIRRLTYFLKRMKSVEQVMLCLISDRRFLKRGPRTHPRRLVNWISAFSECMDVIVANGASVVTVQFENNLEPGEWYTFVRQATYILPFAPLIQRARGFRPPKERVSISKGYWEPAMLPHTPYPLPPKLSSPLRQQLRISTLFLHSMALLTPPMLPWTLEILRQSPTITYISLAHITFSATAWPVILNAIADATGTKLTRFSILQYCWSLSGSELLKFIDRLPNLVQLKIDRTFQIRIEFEASHAGRFNKAQYPVPLLKDLEILEAPEEIILHFLKPRPVDTWFSRSYIPRQDSRSPPLALPSLKSLIIYPCSLLADPTSYTNSMESWSNVLRQINTPERLRKTGGVPLKFGLDVQADFPLHNRIGQYLEMRMISESSAQSQGEALPVFSQISEVILFHFDVTTASQASLSADDDPALFCQWLKVLFPDLRCVRFTCTLPTLKRHVYEMTEETIEALKRELREKVPNSRELWIAQRRFVRGEGEEGNWVESD